MCSCIRNTARRSRAPSTRISSGWEAPLLPGKRYEFKIGHHYVKGLVDSIQHRIDVNDLTTREAEALDLNGLARVRIALEEPVAIDDYKLSRQTGAFIVVDLLHFGTVGA